METYSVLYKCGHEGIIELSGDDSLKKAQYIENNLVCPDCFYENRGFVQFRNERYVQIYELPALTGDADKIEKADMIRDRMIHEMLNLSFYQTPAVARKNTKGLNCMLLNKSADFWIAADRKPLENLLISSYHESRKKRPEKREFLISNAMLPSFGKWKDKNILAARNIRMNMLQNIARENPESLLALFESSCSILSGPISKDVSFWKKNWATLENIESIEEFLNYIASIQAEEDEKVRVFKEKEEEIGRLVRDEQEKEREHRKKVAEHSLLPIALESFDWEKQREIEVKRNIILGECERDTYGYRKVRLDKMEPLDLPIRMPWRSTNPFIDPYDIFCRYYMINNERYFYAGDIEDLLQYTRNNYMVQNDNSSGLFRRGDFVDNEDAISFSGGRLHDYKFDYGVGERWHRVGRIYNKNWLKTRVLYQVYCNQIESMRAGSKKMYGENGWTPELKYLYETIVGESIDDADIEAFSNKLAKARKAPLIKKPLKAGEK